MNLITVTNSEGTHRCDARCHTARSPRCTCVCGGKLHGIALRGDDLVRLTIAEVEAIAERLEPTGDVTYHDPAGKWTTLPLFPPIVTPEQPADQGGNDCSSDRQPS